MALVGAGREKRFWRKSDFWYAEFVALVLRVLFLAVTAGMVRSVDLYSWQKVANQLQAGVNPYDSGTVLAWPPLWMQFIYLFAKVSTLTRVPFILCIQIFLVAADLVLVGALYNFLQVLAPEKSAGKIALWAISMNPVCILLTCQHGNFDGLVALLLVLFLIEVASYIRSGDVVEWLGACLLLGLAILLKTTPFVLVPLLLLGTKRFSGNTKFLGAALTFGPVVLGLSIIFVLAPAQVSENVLGYRGISGFFGVTGLLGLADLSSLSSFYSVAFPFLLLASLAWIAANMVKSQSRSPLFLAPFAAGAMLALPLFGPGYGPQYLFWSIPLVATVYHTTEDRWTKRVIVAAYAVAALTYIAEYSLFRSHGALALQLWPHSYPLRSVAAQIYTGGGQTFVRLPLFASLLAVFWQTVREAKRSAASAS